MSNLVKEVEIRDLGSRGEGIGELNGKVCFVEGALPGEKVAVRLKEEKPRWSRGELVSVIQPSSDRTTPPCPYFDRCGGCQLQHLSYEGQLKLKQERVEQLMRRVGKLKCLVKPTLASPNRHHYRNKIQMPVDAQGRFGLYEKQSHHLIPIDNCLIHCELGEAIYQAVNPLIRKAAFRPYRESDGSGELRHLLVRSSEKSNEALVVLIMTKRGHQKAQAIAETLLQAHPAIKGVILAVNERRGNAVLGEEFSLLAGEASIQEELLGLHFSLSAASFFQVNPRQAEKLYSTALAFAHLTPDSYVVDAYCGVGTLSLLAAKEVKEVVGIEVVPQAIDNAKENAKRNQIENSRFLCSTVEKALSELKEADAVFLNPPRKGCASSVIEALLSYRPKRIVYVSCDPATLARDLALLNEGYHIEKVQPVDMFPQTMHVESVAALSL